MYADMALENPSHIKSADQTWFGCCGIDNDCLTPLRQSPLDPALLVQPESALNAVDTLVVPRMVFTPQGLVALPEAPP